MSKLVIVLDVDCFKKKKRKKKAKKSKKKIKLSEKSLRDMPNPLIEIDKEAKAYTFFLQNMLTK